MSGLSGTFQSRIARRLLLVYVACALVPMSLLALVALHGVTTQSDERADAYLARVCRDAGGQAIAVLDGLDAELAEVGKHMAAIAGEPDVQRALVESWNGPNLEGLALYRDGVLWAARGAHEFETLELAPDESAHIERGAAVLRSAIDAEGGRVLVLLRKTGGSGDPDAVILGLVSTDRLVSRSEAAQGTAELCALLVDGQIVASTLHDAGAEEALLRELDDAGDFGDRLAIDFAGEPWFAALRTTFLRPRFLADVGVVAGIARAEARGAVGDFQRIFLLLTVATVCAALLLAATQIRRQLQPLAALREAAGRVAAGAHDVRTNVATGDEFEEFSRAFDDMAERVLARTADLERANRAKSDFLANVSHELRTPMTSILGYVDLCLDARTGAAERSAHLGIVARSGRHLLAVINDILDYSRIEAGHFEVVREPCSPAQVVQDVASLMSGQAQQKGLDFRVSCLGSLPVTVCTDAMRLRQILLNLVGNALKFTERGAVTLYVRCVRDAAAKDRLVFEVQDSGCGIAPSDLERIFDPFAQADGSRTRRTGGTGLGLTISRHLARELGGDIRAESLEGQGSTFTLTIDPGPLDGIERAPFALDVASQPAASGAGADAHARAESAESLPPALPGPRDGSRPRVLLAEDVAVNRRLIGLILEREGLAVSAVEHGRAALDAFRAAEAEGRPFDLVLTDVQMPQMDGYELARALRSSGWPGAIVALTAHSMEGERERCTAAGCDEFATKPVDVLALRAILARCLPARPARQAVEPVPGQAP